MGRSSAFRLKEEMNEKAFDHAWRYFELHANQRMAVFNFFLVLTGLTAAGIATSLQGAKTLGLLGVSLGLLMALVSFIFWKLDQRVSFLMKRAELAMSVLEADLPKAAKLFGDEPTVTSCACSSGNPWTRHWTYGRSFRVTFWITGIFGISTALISGCRLLNMLQW